MFTARKAIVLILAGSVLWGRSEVSLCGYHPWRTLEEQDLSAKARRRAAFLTRLQPGKLARGTAQDIGNIAIMEDAGGVVSRRNPFNLSGRKLRFQPIDPMAKGYSYALSDASPVEVNPSRRICYSVYRGY